MKKQSQKFWIAAITTTILSFLTLGGYLVGRYYYQYRKQSLVNATEELIAFETRKLRDCVAAEADFSRKHDFGPAISWGFGALMTMMLLMALGQDQLFTGSILQASQQKDLIQVAASFNGAPYNFGSLVPCDQKGGCDCSAFIATVYKEAIGMEMPRLAADQAKHGKRIEDITGLNVGDLVFFDTGGAMGKTPNKVTHVGMISRVEGDDIYMWNAQSYRPSAVTEAKISSKYWASAFMFGNRLNITTMKIKHTLPEEKRKVRLTIDKENIPQTEPTREQLKVIQQAKLETSASTIQSTGGVVFRDMSRPTAALRWAAENNIIKSGSSVDFRPQGTLTRAEISKLICTTIKCDISKKASFPDTNGHWVVDFAGDLQLKGIVKGYSDGSFGPNDAVTSEQAAIMVMRALSYSKGGSGSISDAPTDHWIQEYGGALVGKGVFPAPGKTINFGKFITRQNAVQLLYNANRMKG